MINDTGEIYYIYNSFVMDFLFTVNILVSTTITNYINIQYTQCIENNATIKVLSDVLLLYRKLYFMSIRDAL